MPEDLWTKFSDARYARLKGDYSAAVDGLTEVVNRDPSAYLAWLNLGLANDRPGKSAEAEAAYRRALELEQAQGLDDASLYNTFGYFLYRHGRSPEALPLLEKAVKIDPTHQKAAVNLQAVRAEIH